MITVGKLKEKWLRDGYEEYAKRLGRYCRLELIELPEARLPEHPSGGEIACALESEGKEILKELGIEGDLEGIGHCVLGYPVSDEQKIPAPRKEDYVYYV
jgi:23S rRNA (pseudouridine1915-N3)-methyltransferase